MSSNRHLFMILHWNDHEVKLGNDASISIPAHRLKKNTMIGIFGESGCGKTAFLQHLFAAHRSLGVGYMKQDVLFYPHLTVRETLSLYVCLRNPQEEKHIDDMMSEMRIDHLAHHRVAGLSGGERKRIMIAYMLLDRRSPLLLLDEPFSGLDSENIDLVFEMIRQYNHPHCILITMHHLPFHLLNQLEERWDIINGVMIYSLDTMLESGYDYPPPEESIVFDSPSMFRQALLLCQRDRIACRRNLSTTMLRIFMPLMITVLQGALIGFFRSHLVAWISSGSMMSLLQLFLNYAISLFTVSMIPLAMLSDHFQKRMIVLHETSQGLFSYRAYLLNAVLSDQILMTVIITTICSLSFLPEPIFLVFFATMLIEILFTNLCIWFLVYGARLSYDVSQLLIIAYLSLSFLLNTPTLHPAFHGLRCLSMNHIHTQMMVNALQKYYPSQHASIDQLITMLGMNFHSGSAFIVDLIMMLIPILGLLIFA